MKRRITIGTRASALAMVQANSVIARLRQSWPWLEANVEGIRTRGDVHAEAPLAQVGGDGVFVSELERALQDGRIDLAVHSLKDVPTSQPAGLAVLVVGPREDVRDALVTSGEDLRGALDVREQLARLAEPRRIGTCSLRRGAQIRRLCPGARILPLRGNVRTRLLKLDEGSYDAIVLAAAGLQRLDLLSALAGRASYFPIATLMPAPGQGALAVEIRDESVMRELIQPIMNREAQAATSAERMFMRHLGAGCSLPIAAYGEIREYLLDLQGLVISLDGKEQVRVHSSIPWTAQTGVECAEQLGVQLAEQALAQGAATIIATVNEGRMRAHASPD